jgi:hypothetical protein
MCLLLNIFLPSDECVAEIVLETGREREREVEIHREIMLKVAQKNKNRRVWGRDTYSEREWKS